MVSLLQSMLYKRFNSKFLSQEVLLSRSHKTLNQTGMICREFVKMLTKGTTPLKMTNLFLYTTLQHIFLDAIFVNDHWKIVSSAVQIHVCFNNTGFLPILFP